MHRKNNYTLENLKKLTGGNNSVVYRCLYGTRDAVLKTYDCDNTRLKKILIRKNRELRGELANYIDVPELYDVSTSRKLSILEEYVGISLEEYLKLDNWNRDHTDVLQHCIELIQSFPEDIPIDTNPRNFTIDAAGVIYFVDFMPPNPWDFLEETELRIDFEKCFPGVVSAYKRMSVRKKRYYLRKYRIIKFLHYLDITQ